MSICFLPNLKTQQKCPNNNEQRILNFYCLFSDEEFQKSHIGGHLHTTRPVMAASSPYESLRVKKESKKLPKSVDWRKKGVISRVRQQGVCMSCWAIGASK